MGSAIVPLAGAALGVGALAATGGAAAGALPWLMAAGTGAGATSAIAGGFATSAADTANAKLSLQNANIAKQNAGYTGAEGEINAAAKGEQTRQQVGHELAAQGASGLDVNKGSAVDVRASQAMVGTQDAATIRSNAARQAYGYNTQAAQDIGQANIYKAEGKNAKIAGFVNAATILGTGAAQGAYSGLFDTSGIGSVSAAENGGVDAVSTPGTPYQSYGVTR
jgi:hypothetical protein